MKTPVQLARRIKWIYQRARYGVSDQDIWQGTEYISGIISRTALWIAENGHGFNCCLPEVHTNPADKDCWGTCDKIHTELFLAASHVFAMLEHGEFWKDADGKIIPDYVDDTSQYDIENEMAYYDWAKLFLSEWFGGLSD